MTTSNKKKQVLILCGVLIFGVFATGIVYTSTVISGIKSDNAQLKSLIEYNQNNQVSESQNVQIETGLEKDEVLASSSEESIEKNEFVDTVKAISNPSVKKVTPPAPVVLVDAPEAGPEKIATLETSESFKEEVKSEISIVAVRQTSFPDGYGGTYGAYEIQFAVTPKDNDILISKTTNGSIGTGNIALSYSIIGKEFTGVQNERFECVLLSDGDCKFKADGKTRIMKFTIFLNPDEEGGGNYAVLFDKLTYYQNGAEKDFVINRKTASIQVIY